MRRIIIHYSSNWKLVAFFVIFFAVLFTTAIISRSSDRPRVDKRDKYKVPEDDQYKSPIQLAISRDGKRLYVTCEGTDQLLVVDTKGKKVIDSATVGKHPYGVILSPDERTIYVSNRWSDDVSVIDAKTLKVVHTIPVGDDPHGLVTDREGKTLYVANMSENTISVISTEDFSELKRLTAGIGPFGAALSTDGRYIYFTNEYSNPVPFRTTTIPEVTVIDTHKKMIVERRLIYSTNIVQDVAFSPDGKLAATVFEQPKNLIPETQIYQGWMSTFGLGIIETRGGGKIAQLVLDDMNLYFADPYGVVFTPDGRYIYVTSSGVDVVSVIDVDKVKEVLKIKDGIINVSDEELQRLARDLGISERYVVKRISTQHNPKGIVVSPDGKFVYVANRLSDSISKIDTRKQEVINTIDLGGPKVQTLLRRGEYLFNYSTVSFQRQMSCSTCHPENHLDRINYNIGMEGIGANLVDNRTMRGIADTPPFKWSGKNPTIARQDGPRAAQLFFRSHGFEPDDLKATVAYIESIPVPPNPYLSHNNGELTPAQQRGKDIFERAFTNDHRYIPIVNRCVTCHPEPLRTNLGKYNVGVRAEHDTKEGAFDTPSLNNVFDGNPYLHDGRCYSLDEIWTVYGTEDLHGVVNDLTKNQLNDLIEYLKTL